MRELEFKLAQTDFEKSVQLWDFAERWKFVIYSN